MSVMLVPLGESVGLDFNVETMLRGNTPLQLAYGFVNAGTYLLVEHAYEPDAMPSLDKGTRKRVAKAMTRGLGGQGARDAAIFLTHAFALDLAEFFRCRGDQASADGYLTVPPLVQDHFPLPDDLLARLDATRAEYRTLRTHEVRDEVRTGAEIGTGYSLALLDPDFIDGRDPDQEEQLVTIQKQYAGTFLRGHAVLGAIELTIGRDAYTAVQDKLMFPGGPNGRDGMTFEQLQQVRWTGVLPIWSRTMDRTLGITLPADELPLATTDPIVVSWRERVVTLLEENELGPLPEPTQQALGHFANEMATNEADWGLATDALLTGYGLRAVGHELPTAPEFDEQITARLRNHEDRAPELILVDAALSVAEGLPGARGEGDSRWSFLATWVGLRALDREQARRNAGVEKGDKPTLEVEDCKRAFGLGYGLRCAEEALQPGQN
jgi:hypothetical protein